MPDKTHQKRRTNRAFKSLHKPLTYLGVERTLFYFVCVGAVGAFKLFNSILAGIAVFIGGFAFGHWVTYDPAYRITVEYLGDSTWNCEDFRLDILAADATLLSRSVALRKHPDKDTNSERDWAWVLRELAQGKDAAKLTRKLASRRSDKPNPPYYAQRTVDVASARLWLIEGVPMDDVATMLEVRRRFEIPFALWPRSCTRDCTDGTADDCPEKDCVIQPR
jgi:hypothetical protein